MKLAGFLAITGVLGMLFGLEFLLIPEFALSQYAIPTEPHNLLQARYFGGTLFAYGLIYWLARATHDAPVRRALLIAGVVGNLIGLGLSLWSRADGLQGMLVWLAAGLYAALLLGSIYFLLWPSRRD